MEKNNKISLPSFNCAGITFVFSNLVPFLLFSVLLTGCGGSGSQPAGRGGGTGGPSGPPKQVKLAKAEIVAMERVISATGTLAAYEEATISSKVSGKVKKVPVDLGSAVKRGQLVGQLEQEDYKLRLQQSEAALAQARVKLGLPPEGVDDRIDPEQTGTVRQARALLDDAALKRERMITLHRNGVISKAVMDTAEAEFKVAQSRYQDALEEINNRRALIVQRRSEVNLARQQLMDTSIFSPFDGVVLQKRATEGEYIAPGTPMVTIVKMNPLRLRIDVPEREARSIKREQEMRVLVEGDTNIYTGEIKRISPSISTGNRILVVEAEVRNSGQLRPGTFARAEIVTSSQDKALTIPASALVSFAGIDKVILIQEGKAVEKAVTTGRRKDDRVEILTGLSAGDGVVLEPGSLQSGQPVNVVE